MLREIKNYGPVSQGLSRAQAFIIDSNSADENMLNQGCSQVMDILSLICPATAVSLLHANYKEQAQGVLLEIQPIDHTWMIIPIYPCPYYRESNDINTPAPTRDHI